MNPEQAVNRTVRFYLGGIPKYFKMCPLGTKVHLDATDQEWQAQNFKKWIAYAFPYGRWANIRIQSLTFNGETIFDYRLWPEPPEAA